MAAIIIAGTFDEPDRFDPGRSGGGASDTFALVAQGGGDTNATHRCPGEPLTIGVMKTAAVILIQVMHYDLPEANISVDLHKMPAATENGWA